MAGVIVERRIKVYCYRSDGVHVLSHRKPGTTRPHDEVTDEERERQKQKKRLEAQAKRNRAFADKHKEW